MRRIQNLAVAVATAAGVGLGLVALAPSASAETAAGAAATPTSSGAPTTPGTPTTTPAPVATSASATPTRPIADYTCSLGWYVTSQTDTSFTALVTVSNPSSAFDLTGPWQVGFRLPDGQVVTSIADGVATFTQSGDRVTITGAAPYSTLPKQSSRTFALTATWNGVSNQPPTNVSQRSEPGIAFPFGCQVVTTPPVTEPPLCTVDYQVLSQWPGGFMARVAVINRSAPLTSWVVQWQWPNSQTITHLWNGENLSSGGTATAANAGWNGKVPTNGSASFGFIGTWNGTTNGAPTSATLNGVPCNVV